MKYLIAFSTVLATLPALAESRSLTHDGQPRSYLVQAPAVASTGARPVVVLLHGGTQSPEQVWKQTSLPALAQRDGFILVAPRAIGRHWNDGRGSTLSAGGPSSADDVGFLRGVIADVLQRDRADADAVFMVGASNGGFMTARFACEAGELLHAAATAISNLPRDLARSCRPARPLPWLAINGTDDPLIPFGGSDGTAVKAGQRQPALLSADASFAFWADHAGCDAAITVEWTGQAERRERSGCAGAAHSVQLVLHGAGHAWPGKPIDNPLIRRVVGTPNLDVDAGTLIWDHFRSSIARR
jgi:polyhydroxybutyrate depolymerase